MEPCDLISATAVRDHVRPASLYAVDLDGGFGIGLIDVDELVDGGKHMPREEPSQRTWGELAYRSIPCAMPETSRARAACHLVDDVREHHFDAGLMSHGDHGRRTTEAVDEVAVLVRIPPARVFHFDPEIPQGSVQLLGEHLLPAVAQVGRRVVVQKDLHSR